MSGCLKQEGSPEAENIEGIRLLSRNGIVLKIVTVTPQPAPIISRPSREPVDWKSSNAFAAPHRRKHPDHDRRDHQPGSDNLTAELSQRPRQ